MRLHKFSVAVLGSLLLVVALRVAAQDGASPEVRVKQKEKVAGQRSSAKPRKRDPEMQAIIDAAALVPPEFAADVLLRLVESDRIAERLLKIELAARAFYLAESAQQPVKKRSAQPGGAVDTRPGYRSMAFRLNLDRLSLQSRAVNDMLPLDRAKARALVEQIRFPSLIPLGCEETLVYDSSLFYQMLGNVVRQGFTREEKLQERELQVLQPYITQLQSHAQVLPVAQLLRTVDLSNAQLRELVNMFAGSLQRLHGDKRSFASVVRYFELDSLARLVTELDSKGISTAAIIPAVGEYLVSNLRDVPCSEVLGEPAGANSVSEAARYFVDRFNAGLGAGLEGSKIAPVREGELQGAPDSSRPRAHAYWQSRKSQEFSDRIRTLRFGTGETPLSLAERKAFAWSAQLSDFLKEFESWKPDDEPADDFFHEKSILYTGLIELAPSGPERSKVVRSYSEFLGQNYFQRESRIEWVWHVDDLFEQIASADDPSEVLEILLRSRDATLSLYARLERLTPRPTDGTAQQ